MLFSYMLPFFAVISSISVLAAPLPEERKPFDFDPAYDDSKLYGVVNILSPEGKDLAKGKWLRTALSDKVCQWTFQIRNIHISCTAGSLCPRGEYHYFQICM